MLRPWQKVLIKHSSEELVTLPLELYRLEPHCYQSLGAPYGTLDSPWMLREEVAKRLLAAQGFLKQSHNKYRLAIFDAWRPIRVQKFMYEYSINQECIARGINRNLGSENPEIIEVIDSVNKFWALPCMDSSMPPPHSTGAAVDLTLALSNGNPLDMGGEIDFMGSVSTPDYYSKTKNHDQSFNEYLWHARRSLLKNVMQEAGFVQHPNEWWHFSFGDQLWAWGKQFKECFYGAVDTCESNSLIS
ncbi:M15 family metallopeptidase [Prochlorococcus marinus]|uniref:M15 family metallopeptidase n=1 Tax=Prochlorococcus marinus TaxID=1219 RepID=UPI0022B5BF25|nr:M15 family metallopeptidase [Prochlorococcus marinus]